MSLSVADVLARLEKVKQIKTGWTALCPAHKDEHPSLSVAEGEDGKVLLRCHAGCEYHDVARALGIGREHARFVPARRTSTMETAELVTTYAYTDEHGKTLFRVKRFRLADGSKTFSQDQPDGAGEWVPNVKGARRVPYRLPKVIETAKAGGVVCVVEGEKDVHALEGLGLVATTNAGGAGKWLDIYSTSLKGASLVVVLPDNDEPGRNHGQLVAASLSKAGVPVKVVSLPGVPEKGDASDWIAAGGTKDQFAALVEAAALYQPVAQSGWQPPIPLDQYDVPPFPVDTLPPVMRDFVAALAVATQTPPDLPAMVSLATLAASCGGKVKVMVRPGYSEPVNLFTVVALPPASRKSAVFHDATQPLREWEISEARRLEPEIKKNRSQRKVLERAIETAQAKAAKAEDFKARMMAEGEIASRQAELDALPLLAPPRVIADDTTTEKLTMLMAGNDERMAVMSSEGGVFGIMAGRYSKNDSGNFEIYLKGHSGDHLTVDRIGRPSDVLHHPALTMGLTVQPDVIEHLSDTPAFRGRGLLARFLYSLPKSNVGRRAIVPPSVPVSVYEAYRQAVTTLLDIPLMRNDDGALVPYVLHLSYDATAIHTAFAEWIEPRLAETGEFGFMADWAGKLAGAVVRIAGLLHMATHAASPKPWEIAISGKTMQAAVRIGRYLLPHAEAAFIEMNADESTSAAKHVLKWIARKDVQAFTTREAHCALKGRFKKVDDIKEGLEILETHGFVRALEAESTGKAGRPSEAYKVNPLTAVTLRQPKKPWPGFVDFVDFVPAISTPPSPASSPDRSEAPHGGSVDFVDFVPPSATPSPISPASSTQSAGGSVDSVDFVPPSPAPSESPAGSSVTVEAPQGGSVDSVDFVPDFTPSPLIPPPPAPATPQGKVVYL